MPWPAGQERKLADLRGQGLTPGVYRMTDLSWSPDAEWILFDETPLGAYELVLVENLR
jgi:hypothetical protein